MLLFSNTFYFAGKKSSLDWRRKLLQMIQICPSSLVSPKTALEISSSFLPHHFYMSTGDISIQKLSEAFILVPYSGGISVGFHCQYLFSSLGGLSFGICCDGGGGGGGNVGTEKELMAAGRKSTKTILSI
jgi:hypothetical protein